MADIPDPVLPAETPAGPAKSKPVVHTDKPNHVMELADIVFEGGKPVAVKVCTADGCGKIQRGGDGVKAAVAEFVRRGPFGRKKCTLCGFTPDTTDEAKIAQQLRIPNLHPLTCPWRLLSIANS